VAQPRYVLHVVDVMSIRVLVVQHEPVVDQILWYRNNCNVYGTHNISGTAKLCGVVGHIEGYFMIDHVANVVLVIG
jgi:hypothetical protein